jgi:hypothetical protein
VKRSNNQIPRIFVGSIIEKFLSNKTLSEKSSYTLQDMCRILGHASKNGRAQAYVISLVYYGVLDKVMVQTDRIVRAEYQISKLGVALRKCSRKNIPIHILRKMVLAPKTFHEIYKNLLGRNIDNASNDMFKKTYGLTETSSKNASRVFAQDMREAELVDADGILIDPDGLYSDKSSFERDTATSSVDDLRRVVLYLPENVEISFPARLSSRIWEDGAKKVFSEISRNII